MLTLLWRLLYCSWVAVEIYVVFTRTRSKRNKGKNPDRGSMLVLWVVIFSAITAANWVAALDTSAAIHGASWMRMLALALLAAGLAVRVTAIYTLGKSFTANVTIRDTHQLHRSGLFRFMRHPSYTGMLLIFLALGLRMQNWIALVLVTIPPFAALLYRIHVEEAALTGAFGEQYRDYSRETKRLIPGIY